MCGYCDAVDSSAVSAAWSGLDTAEVGASGLSRKQPTHSQDPQMEWRQHLIPRTASLYFLVYQHQHAHIICCATQPAQNKKQISSEAD